MCFVCMIWILVALPKHMNIVVEVSPRGPRSGGQWMLNGCSVPTSMSIYNTWTCHGHARHTRTCHHHASLEQRISFQQMCVDINYCELFCMLDVDIGCTSNAHEHRCRSQSLFRSPCTLGRAMVMRVSRLWIVSGSNHHFHIVHCMQDMQTDCTSNAHEHRC